MRGDRNRTARRNLRLPPAVRRPVVAVALLLATLAGAPRGAPLGASPGASTRDFRIETDQTNSNLNTGDFTMPHHVRFYRPGTDVVGDSAKGNFKNGTVSISGHVVLHDNGQSAEAQQAGAASGGGPATLTCDRLDVDSKQKIYIATGNVHYVQGTRHATAEHGKLDQGQHLLDLSGNVRLADGDETLTAQTVHYDTLTKDLSTGGSPVILSQPASPAPGTLSTLPTPAAKATPKPK
jgi:lipopolysaccharide assembly outer membrane protein LptD (OstA)